jgi:hypothetical protein
MSWIDDEAKKAKDSDEERKKREETYDQQVWGLWQDLERQIKQDAEAINQNADLVSRRLGGEKLQIQTSPDGANGLQVVKIVYTAIYLKVKFRHRYVDVERVIVTNGQDRQSREEAERLDIDIDPNYRLYFKDENGKPITVADLSQRLLTPLLNT